MQDLRYESATGGGYRGSDDDHLAIARRILEGLGIPLDEVANAVVLAEKLQTARRDGDRYVAGPTTDGKRYVEASRRVGRLPVFSSRAFIGITERKSAGTLEVHWPQISEDVLRRGNRLQDLVAQSWKPPVKVGGRIESVEAGVIHSPAIGFVMDIVPVIRVIVAPEDRSLGRKASFTSTRTAAKWRTRARSRNSILRNRSIAARRENSDLSGTGDRRSACPPPARPWPGPRR